MAQYFTIKQNGGGELNDIIVIGGGASGMMSAIQAAQQGCEVVLLEKMATCGRKIRITGKGRCNVTTMKTREEILAAVRSNPKFMYSSLSAFDNKDTWNFFESRGCPLKVERGERVFPQSDRAQDIIDVLVKEMQLLGVRVVCETPIKSLSIESDGTFTVVSNESERWQSRAVIVCTGGASYPGTGCSGDAYSWMRDLGLKVQTPYPALVPLVSDEKWVQELQGLSLRNIQLVITNSAGKRLYSEQGEMLFTHFGISGPVVLSASGHCSAYWQKKREKLEAHIDLKPALSEQKLDARLLREIQEMPNKQLASLMKKLLPQKMVPIFIKRCGVQEARVLHQLTKEERQKIIALLKDFSFELTKTRDLTEGIVTAGGLSVKEVHPKTLEVKKIPGLFVAGELLDIDAYTGGFNLQIAFSTGYCAGRAASDYVKEGE